MEWFLYDRDVRHEKIKTGQEGGKLQKFKYLKNQKSV